MKVSVITGKIKIFKREYKGRLFCFWHPSAIISLLLNFIVWLPKKYHKCYYRRDNWGRLFHCVRRTIQLIFFMLTFYFYMSPSSTLVFPFLILLFILVMAENIVSQWATFIVFLNISPETIFAIITTNPSARLSFRSFWESVRDGIDGGNEKISLNKLLMLYDKPQFKEALKEVLSEIKKNLKLLKAEVLRVTLLPFKYIVSILIALALLVMALQVNWNGKAFKGLIFQNAESRNILSFTADMIECLYFSSVSVATIGYGTIAPKVSDEAEETNNCDLRFPSTFPVRGLMFGTALILLFTIFAAFSMAFRGVDELMKRLNDPKDLEFVIKELLERGIEDPTSFFIK